MSKYQGWTLFLDRDGVINEKLEGGYIKSWEEFKFKEGALFALKNFKTIFENVLIVTNQRGIARGIMTHEALSKIHASLLNTQGVNIDKIYYCPDLDGSPNRKPNTGMADQAKKEFPKIDFNKSIMVGDSLSDMQFGKAKGMTTILIKSEKKINYELVDYAFFNLKEVFSFLKEA